MSRDWYKDRDAGVGPQSDAEYREWVQDIGYQVDAADNVIDYGTAEMCPGGCHEFYGGQPCDCTCHEEG